MHLRERAPVFMVTLLAAATAASLAIAIAITSDDALVQRWSVLDRDACSRDVVAAPEHVVPADHITVDGMYLPAADEAYRHHAFDEAARIAGEAAKTDARYTSLAELYYQHAHAYSIAIDPAARPTTRYEALREAKKLDVVLGGRFVDELDVALALDAPKAAIVYLAADQIDDAELACAVAESLGLWDEPNVHAVRAKLKQLADQQRHLDVRR